MSKIFEVLRKRNVLADEPDEHSTPAQDRLRPTPVSGEAESLATPLPPPLPEDPAASVSLRVSAFSPVFPFSGKTHAAAMEQYRIIRTKILHHPRKPRVVMVSSACSGDGKTVSAVNIAASLSLKDHASVLLMDTDLRRPRLAELLGVPAQPGLTDVLRGRVNLESAIRRTKQFPNLSVLAAGETVENAAELLDSEVWRTTVDQVRSAFTNIVLDTTPAGVVADYDLLRQVSDGIIFVMRPDHTDRNACMDALRSIPKEQFLGVVLNCTQRWLMWGAPGYYREYKQEDRKQVRY